MLNTKQAAQSQRSSIDTRIRDLENQLDSQQSLRKLLPSWNGVEKERHFFEELFSDLGEVVTRRDQFADIQMESIAAAEATETTSSKAIPATPNAGLVAEASKMVTEALASLQASVLAAFTVFEAATTDSDSPLMTLRDQRWQREHDQIRQEFEAAQQEALAAGARVQAIDEIPGQLLDLNAQLKELDKGLGEIERLTRKRENSLSVLRKVWRDQTEVRTRKANELMDHLRPRPGGKPYVDIRVDHQADPQTLLRLLSDKCTDKRRLNEDDINRVLERVATDARDESTSLLV